jgi:hypothetical protein
VLAAKNQYSVRRHMAFRKSRWLRCFELFTCSICAAAPGMGKLQKRHNRLDSKLPALLGLPRLYRDKAQSPNTQCLINLYLSIIYFAVCWWSTFLHPSLQSYKSWYEQHGCLGSDGHDHIIFVLGCRCHCFDGHE